MNQRIHDLRKWKRLEDGFRMFFEKKEPRVVVLEVNCPVQVEFFVSQWDADTGEGETVFLATAKGRDRIEFAVDGPFELAVAGGDAYIYTFDGQDIATHVVAPEVYTRLANRKARNPHLEMIEYRMKLNQQRFFAELEQEQERRIEDVKHELASYLPERSPLAPPDLVGKEARQERVEERAAQEVVGEAEPAAGKPKRKRKAVDDDVDDPPF